MRGLITLGLMVVAVAPARAHGVGELATDWVFWALLASLVIYVFGLVRTRQRPSIWRPSLFVVGWILLFIALVGPVEHWAHLSLAGHMTQHMILLAVAPPLLLLARPMPQFMQALTPSGRRRIGPLLGNIYSVSGRTPVLAFIAHGLVIWFWHLPMPYQLALEYWLIHDLEHLLFFATGLWFWWSLIAPGRLGLPGFGMASILAVLTLM
ncbi:MAG: cytochrome c oxidase assembly protein, partial [Wenzhouxiangella sp.]